MNAHTNKKTAYVAPSGHDRRGVCGCDPRDVAVAARAGPGGPVQFRLSEAVCVLAVLTPAAVPGLTIGCAIANLIALAINGTGALGLLDVAFGSLATFLGALWCWKLRDRPKLALLGPVIANALIVPAYLPLLLQGLGYYTIPFTSVALDGLYLPMYLFGVVSTGIGEALVMYALGLPLLSALRRSGVVQQAAA